MNRQRITDVVKSGRILISDGAWGTELQKKGLKPGECPELWCLTRPDDIFELAKSYLEAGADMVETNSFGGSGIKLDYYGLKSKVKEINESAARISRRAAGEDKWVIASMGPTGKMLIMGDVTEQELYDSFKEQAMALELGGADAICIETMSAVDEAVQAIRAVRENTSLEVICTFTFDKTVRGDYRTMMGTSPREAALESMKAGADIVGTNCGNGFERMIDIVTAMREVSGDVPLLVHANAGLPVTVNGASIFPDTPEDMAALVPALLKAGASIIGGCCGTDHRHIGAIKKAVAAYISK
ncbi:MAG: homocysteine S-methyltransferase family protein [Spirochaetota bacterium]